MKFSPEILEELQGISPVLAEIEKINTLSVPEGYFDTLTLDLIKKVNPLSSEATFSVPEGYFDTLTVDVLKNINTESYKKNLSVPEGYFNNLSNEILNKIKASEVPASQELRTLSPMLYSVQSENVFEVPTGYFNNLSENILEKVSERPQAKVVEFKRRKSVWQYAVAAVATGIIAVSSLMIFNKSGQSIDYENSVSAYIQEASKFKNEQQVNAGIASLSDDEIIKYLEKTGTDSDNEVLTKSVDEQALPNETDYLLNEQTLDKYLSTINKNSNN